MVASGQQSADLALSGTAASHVIEGRSVTYELKITNNGPDTATNISLHSLPAFDFVSVNASHGKCKLVADNVYCEFATLKKNETVDVKIVERCPWGKYYSDYPGYEPPGRSGSKHVTVHSNEKDPSYENNDLTLTTEVYRDSNKGPVIQVLSPTSSQPLQGPAATVLIRIKASDPDGFIKKLELFAKRKSLGEPTFRSDGEYELLYKDLPFGSHSVTIVATDNLGRVETTQTTFFVNGPAKVEITNPKAGSRLNKADGEFTVTIHATSPSALKKVSLQFWNSDATAVGNDEYVVKLKSCNRKCQLQAIAVDENGIKTFSESVEFTMLTPPETRLVWSDGEYGHEFEAGKPFKVSELELVASAEHTPSNAAKIAKLEIFANGVLVCTDDSVMFGASSCIWKPAPGKYKLQAVAVDEDGAVGKSDLIEVVIERP